MRELKHRLSAAKAAKLINFSSVAVSKWCNDGTLPARRTPTGDWEIYPDDLLSLLNDKAAHLDRARDALREMLTDRRDAA